MLFELVRASSQPLLTDASLPLYSILRKDSAEHVCHQREGGQRAQLPPVPKAPSHSPIQDLEADHLKIAFFLLNRE